MGNAFSSKVTVEYIFQDLLMSWFLRDSLSINSESFHHSWLSALQLPSCSINFWQSINHHVILSNNCCLLFDFLNFLSLYVKHAEQHQIVVTEACVQVIFFKCCVLHDLERSTTATVCFQWSPGTQIMAVFGQTEEKQVRWNGSIWAVLLTGVLLQCKTQRLSWCSNSTRLK